MNKNILLIGGLNSFGVPYTRDNKNNINHLMVVKAYLNKNYNVNMIDMYSMSKYNTTYYLSEVLNNKMNLRDIKRNQRESIIECRKKGFFQYIQLPKNTINLYQDKLGDEKIIISNEIKNNKTIFIYSCGINDLLFHEKTDLGKLLNPKNLDKIFIHIEKRISKVIENIEFNITELKKINRDIEIYMLGVYIPTRMKYIRKRVYKPINLFNDALNKLCLKYKNVFYVDNSNLTINEMAHVDWHPKKEGQILIGENIIKEMMKNDINNELQLTIKELCYKYKLGNLININKINGGLMHKMYKVETSSGLYAIKILNPEVMRRKDALNNYVLSEKISNLVKENNIFVSSALTFNNESVIKLNDKYFMIFNFVNGKVLSDSEIGVYHCSKIGSILARIHNIDYKVLGLKDEIICDNYSINWYELFEIAKNRNKKYVSLLENNIDKYDSLYKSCMNIYNENNKDVAICHRDMDPKNVLWNNDNPVIIDWESAKLSNPYRELIETALSWSGFLSNNFDENKFLSFIKSYNEIKKVNNINWNNIILGNLIGRLGWLEYNLKRNLGIKSNDEEEMNLAEKEIYKTIDEINRYLNISSILENLLIHLK